MRTIILIPCVKEKLPVKAKAEKLYIGPFFQKNISYAKSIQPSKIFILSGKYGLVSLDVEIEPYDINLHEVSDDDLKDWSARVLEQLRRVADLQDDHFIILVDDIYSKHLLPEIEHYDIRHIEGD